MDRDKQITEAKGFYDESLELMKSVNLLKNKIATRWLTNTHDKDIKSGLGVLFDGLSSTANGIEDFLSDSDISILKTENDLLNEEEERQGELDYQETKRSIYNEGRL